MLSAIISIMGSLPWNKIGIIGGIAIAIGAVAYVQGCNDGEDREKENTEAVRQSLTSQVEQWKRRYTDLINQPAKVETTIVYEPRRPEGGTVKAEILEHYRAETEKWKEKYENEADMAYRLLAPKQTSFDIRSPGKVNVVHYPWKPLQEQFQWWSEPLAFPVTRIKEEKIVPVPVQYTSIATAIQIGAVGVATGNALAGGDRYVTAGAVGVAGVIQVGKWIFDE